MKLSLILWSGLASSVLAAPAVVGKPGKFRDVKRSTIGSHPNIAVDQASAEAIQQTNGSLYGDDYSSNWAGAVITAPPAGTTFTQVFGQWTIPEVSAPTSGDGTWYSAEWVGIDGDTYGNAILQAGTLSTVTVSGGVSTVSVAAWYEWYPQQLFTTNEIAINTGDTVTVGCYATSTTTGTVVINNLSSGASFTIDISAPSADAALGGQNAEWILEDITSGGLVPMSNFATTYFTGCVATCADGSTVGLSSATQFDMVQNGNTIATGVIISDSELEVYSG